MLESKQKSQHRVRTHRGNVRKKTFRESGNSMMCQGKMKFCKKKCQKCQGILYKARMFGPDIFFLLNS